MVIVCFNCQLCKMSKSEGRKKNSRNRFQTLTLTLTLRGISFGEINLSSSSNEVRRPKGPKATDAFIAFPCGQRPKGSASAFSLSFSLFNDYGSKGTAIFSGLPYTYIIRVPYTVCATRHQTPLHRCGWLGAPWKAPRSHMNTCNSLIK